MALLIARPLLTSQRKQVLLMSMSISKMKRSKMQTTTWSRIFPWTRNLKHTKGQRLKKKIRKIILTWTASWMTRLKWIIPSPMTILKRWLMHKDIKWRSMWLRGPAGNLWRLRVTVRWILPTSEVWSARWCNNRCKRNWASPLSDHHRLACPPSCKFSLCDHPASLSC